MAEAKKKKSSASKTHRKSTARKTGAHKSRTTTRKPKLSLVEGGAKHTRAHAHSASHSHAHGKKRTSKTREKSGAPHRSEFRSQPCSVTGCHGSYRAKGYCTSHYRAWRQGEMGHARYKVCKDYGCNKAMAQNRHGFCEDHYQRYYIQGVERPRLQLAPKPESNKPSQEAPQKEAA